MAESEKNDHPDAGELVWDGPPTRKTRENPNPLS